MAKRHRPIGNCPSCHRHDVRYVVTTATGALVMACGTCAARYDRVEDVAVERVG